MARSFIPSIQVDHAETMPSPDNLLEEGTLLMETDAFAEYRWQGKSYRLVPGLGVELLSNGNPMPTKWDIVTYGKDKTVTALKGGAVIREFGGKQYYCLPIAGRDGEDWEVRRITGFFRQGGRFIRRLASTPVA